MKHTWTMLGLSALILSALPAVAVSQDRKNTDGQPADRPATAQQVEDLSRTLKTSADRLNDRLNAMDEKLEQELRSLRARGMTTDLNVATAQKEINDLKDQIARLRQELDGRGRMAFYPPAPSASGPGRVLMTNSYFQPVAVVINGLRYDLMPGEQRYSSPISAGTFTYEVLGIQGPTPRSLAAGETFAINVYPR
jgi:hypothetical protein